MARAVAKSTCKREMYAMSQLKGLPNVLEAQALMRHKDPKTGKQFATIVTKIIHPGSLQSILDNKSWKLTLKERVAIACDIMSGISQMQEKGFAHCDLGARNYFVGIEGKKPGHRKIKAYVADFGRTIPIATAKDNPVQGNSRYTPPEAIFRKKMQGNHYLQSDLFAVGCVFWRLYFGKLPGWSMSEYFNNESIAKKERYRAKVYHINAIRGHYSNKLKSSPAKKHTPTLREGFLKVILQMTDPSPAGRGEAILLHRDLCQLLGRPLPKIESENKGKSHHKDGKNTKRHGIKKK
jgi:serine/threonine protein kinase